MKVSKMLHSGIAVVGNSISRDSLFRVIHQKIERSSYCRQVLVDDIVTVLSDGSKCGVILVGEYGAGKSFLAKKALAQLGDNAQIIQIRGNSMAADIPYGALSSLLNELDEDTVDNPLAVLRGLTAMLRNRAHGRSIFLCVDNVQYLDELTALVVSQLTANGTVRLLAACEDLTRVPGGIVGLWKDGLVRRVEVHPFNQDETAQWLVNALDAKVSRALSEALWEASGGNPRFAEVLLPEQIALQTIVQQDGIWVLSGKPFEYSAAVADTVMTSLSSFSTQECLVMDVLALAGGLTLDRLLGIGDPLAINTLQQRGYLDITRGEPSRVRIANRLIVHILRRQAPVGRSRDLYRSVARLLAGTEVTEAEELSMAVWSLSCGLALAPETALRAAQLANASGNPEAALSLVGVLRDRGNRLEALALEVHALIALGQTEAARKVISAPDLDAEHLPLARWVELQLLRARLAGASDTQQADPQAILDEVATRLGREGERETADAQGLVRLDEVLVLARAELAIHRGRYLEFSAELTRIHVSGSSADRRGHAGRLLCEVQTLTGRQAQAVKLAGEMTARNVGDDLLPARWDVADSAILLTILTGSPAPVRTVTDMAMYSCTFTGARAVAFGELGEGLLLAYRGRTQQALEHLLPAASQLHQLDPDGTAALAGAAAAYAYALQGDNDRALQYLNNGTSSNVRTSRMLASGCAYFQVLASAELASKDKAIVRLFSLADQERRCQARSAELMFVTAAVRLGSTADAQRLIDVAAGIEGPFALLCKQYGTGLLTQDAAVLTSVAAAALRSGDDLFARDVARSALKIAVNDADRRYLMRDAQQIIRMSLEKLGGIKRTNEDGEVLTVREQEVAGWAAAGVSNRAIAAKMHISVRTVEGHLYQIYAKLQVTSRSELKDTFA
ncbi:AAA family ATPase [Paeniglutamicibacter antarcticus]|uniref:AAA family ATPase n=1 Tax=Arthrobacter terrae TaxID=2935737 RepID=A0A931CLY7_9MICC|nr:helix-turn-helix transcriptional regulator [Arthrobacter terrae]MBG0738321.1 AAA family ATPase [Arthrobacter terrae]